MQDENHTPGNSEDARLAALLREYPTPAPDDGFYDAVVATAVERHGKAQRNRWLMTGFGGAVAAGIVLMFVSSVFLSPVNTPANDIPGVQIALAEERTINLVFTANEPMQDATLTVDLPDGVELAGFPMQRQVSWETSLAAGKNLLPLKLIATTPQGGELLAELKHDDRRKAFRLQVNIG